MDFTGRPMKGYVYVDPGGIATDQELQTWVDLCAEYVLTLASEVAIGWLPAREPGTCWQRSAQRTNPVFGSLVAELQQSQEAQSFRLKLPQPSVHFRNSRHG